MGYAVFNENYFSAVDLDILQYLSNGLTPAEISREFCVDSDRPSLEKIQVEEQICNLQQLLSCRTSQQLVATAIRNHIII